MSLLSYLYRQSPLLWLLGCITGVIAGLSGAGLIAVISKGVAGDGQVAALAWQFFGLCAVFLACKSGSEIALLHLTQKAILGMRVSLSRKLLATPFKTLESVGKPGLLVILTKDIDAFIGASQLLPQAFGNSIIILTCLAYMASLSLPVFVGFTLSLAVCVVAFRLAERRPLRQLARVREVMDSLYQHFRDLIEGSKELQLNAARGALFVSDVIEPEAHRFRRSLLQAMVGYTWVSNVGSIMFYLLIGALLFLVPLCLPDHGAPLATIILILLYLIRPISELMSAMPALGQANIALGKIRQLSDMLSSNPHQDAGPDPFTRPGPLSLELDKVCHSYTSQADDSQFVLGPLDLKIGQGEIVFIVGGNGSGKTTLAMLLLGLYLPEGGVIRLNGAVVGDGNLDAYRRHFSAVFADFHLFEQLLASDKEDLAARASHYIRLLGMAHKVRIENGKFTTINLSSGQRKRLALVSSYLEDRPVYLFDEWAADQDPVFKRIFYTELLPELKARGKTVIVISHDDAYFNDADRVIKVVDGKLHTLDNAHRPAPLLAGLHCI
jgi:putative ATP-binding cassette transporter